MKVYKILTNIILASSLFYSSLFAQEENSPDVIKRIREEALTRSNVMDHAFYLSDVSGPRLSGSPGLKRSQEWAMNTLKSWNLQNVMLEPWGKFGRGWELKRFYLAMTKPYYHTIIGAPAAWTPGTNGVVNSEIVVLKLDSIGDFDRYKGKLTGRIVMIDTDTRLKTSFSPEASRFTDDELGQLETPIARPRRGASSPNAANERALRLGIPGFLLQEKVALLLSMAYGSYGTVFNRGGASQAENAKPIVPEVEISSEDFLRVLRLAKAGVSVEMEADVKTAFFADDLQGYNVVADIPGTDPNLKDEFVLLGAHLDSWHLATGATDNAAGCAVMMEVVRIFKELNLKPRRTIRLVLWSSEEQGLFGSKGYVKNHFGNLRSGVLQPEHEKVSAYFNLDNGTGKIRGIYSQGNEAVKPIFTEWLKPFNDLGATTVTVRNTSGTDHVPFDAIGIPGFQFIQDRIDYGSRTHHSNQDTFDRLLAEDLKQATAVIAAFVYNTAQRTERLPRKVLPKGVENRY